MDDFTCPDCGGHYFGTDGGDDWQSAIGRCHDQFGVNCKFQWPRADDDLYMTDGEQEMDELETELRIEALHCALESERKSNNGAFDVLRNAERYLAFLKDSKSESH